jgi:hypothetical protein
MSTTTAAELFEKHGTAHRFSPKPGDGGGGWPEPDMIMSREWPEPPHEAIYHGLAGEIVRTIDPHTEADPVAILVQFLVAFGSAVGRGPHFLAEADRHGANLFAVFVGETAKGRKGSSWGQARRVVEMAEADWTARVKSGLSSGEA